MLRVISIVVMIGLLVAGGASARAATPALTVFAAADLALPFSEIAPRFEKALGAQLTLVFGSTGMLTTQLTHGAPADVFFAANESFVDRLVATRAAIAETRMLYAQGRLALVTPKALSGVVRQLRDLAAPSVRRVAIANPQHAPYGQAAEQALRASGLWQTVAAKLVYGENVRQAVQFVQSGAAEAGIVALSLSGSTDLASRPVDPALHAPLNQAAVVMRRSGRPELARGFIQFVNGPEGRPIMKRYGFILPGQF